MSIAMIAQGDGSPFFTAALRRPTNLGSLKVNTRIFADISP
jgi:hypothetical protein